MSVKSIVIKAVVGVVILALLIVGVIWLKKTPPKEQNGINQETIEMIGIYSADSNTVKRIEIAGEESFAIYKDEDDVWNMENMEGIEVNKAFADALAISMTDISSPMLVEENAAEYDVYGLDNPQYEVKIVFDDGEEKIHLVGKVSGEYYYFLAADSDDVYIVSKQDLYMVFMEQIKYLNTDVIDVASENIAKVEYGDVVVEKVGEYWFEREPYERICDDYAVKSEILGAVSSISADSIVKRAEVTTDIADSVTVTLSTGECVNFDVYPKDENYFYVTTDQEDYAYVVTCGRLRFLSVTGFDIMNKYVSMISLSEISKIEFIDANGKRTITIDAPESEAPIFYLDEKMADDVSVREFYTELMSLTFNGTGTASGAAQYAIIYTKTDGEKIDIRFSSASEFDFAVSINGKTQFTIYKKSVTDIFDIIKEITVL